MGDSGGHCGSGSSYKVSSESDPAGFQETTRATWTLSLGWTGDSRISLFRNLICCPFIRFAKFRAKLDMLSMFPQPKFQIWHTWGLPALCTGPRPKQKMRFRPPETPFSSETDGFHQIDDTHDESIYGNFIFGSIVFDFWDFLSRRGSSLTSPPFFLERNYANFMKISTKLDSGAIETVSRN